MKKVRILLLAGALILALASTSLAFSYSATDLPKWLPDHSTVTSTINVTDHGIISDLDVFVNLTHSYVSDFYMTVSHAGTSIYLMYHEDGGGNNVYNVLFNDEAATSITSGNPPYGPGEYRPTAKNTGTLNLLSVFDGLDIYGDWVLTFSDTVWQDYGRLYDFRIEGTVAGCQVPIPGSALLLGSGLSGLFFFRRRFLV